MGAVARMGPEGLGQQLALESLDFFVIAGYGVVVDISISSLPDHSSQCCRYSQSAQSQQMRFRMNAPARMPLSASFQR